MSTELIRWRLVAAARAEARRLASAGQQHAARLAWQHVSALREMTPWELAREWAKVMRSDGPAAVRYTGRLQRALYRARRQRATRPREPQMLARDQYALDEAEWIAAGCDPDAHWPGQPDGQGFNYQQCIRCGVWEGGWDWDDGPHHGCRACTPKTPADWVRSPFAAGWSLDARIAARGDQAAWTASPSAADWPHYEGKDIWRERAREAGVLGTDGTMVQQAVSAIGNLLLQFG